MCVFVRVIFNLLDFFEHTFCDKRLFGYRPKGNRTTYTPTNDLLCRVARKLKQNRHFGAVKC